MPRAGSSALPWSELSKTLASAIRDLAQQGFRGPFAVADGRIIHNAGGSEAQELAFALSSALDCLRALEAGGIALDAARSMIYFRLAADADEFLNLAKFRAIRKLWARVEQACGLTPKPTTVAAETAWRMMTRRDPYVNMLRTTIAVTAAGLGGADNILALPHTVALGLPDALARRIARNTQLVLLEESNLAKVSDPAAGSGAIENLTEQMCKAAWALFQKMDAAGGAWASLEQGPDPARSGQRARRARKGDCAAQGRAHRRDRLSEFAGEGGKGARRCARSPRRRKAPPPSSRCRAFAFPRRSKPCATNPMPCSRRSARGRKCFWRRSAHWPTFPRARCTRRISTRPAASRRASGDGFKDQAAMIAAFKKSGAKLACLCGSDAVYAEQAADAAKALRRAGAIVHLAGRPGELEAALKDAGVKAFIFVGCDVLSTLQAAYDNLGAS